MTTDVVMNDTFVYLSGNDKNIENTTVTDVNGEIMSATHDNVK